MGQRTELRKSKPIKTVFNKPIYMGAVILETSTVVRHKYSAVAHSLFLSN